MVWTGTLTQNKMAVSRLWMAGKDFQGRLDGLANSSNCVTAEGLDPRLLSTLVKGVALNSTAELRDNGSKHSALLHCVHVALLDSISLAVLRSLVKPCSGLCDLLACMLVCRHVQPLVSVPVSSISLRLQSVVT